LCIRATVLPYYRSPTELACILPMDVHMTTRPAAREQLDCRTLCDAVFLKLRDEIVSGTLKAGQRLEQKELADRFGISRMPVRDALRRLEAEGLVVVQGRRGVIVPTIDVEEMREIYRIREVLEALAVRLAVPNLTDEDVVALSRLERQMEESSRGGDLEMWLRLDGKFHLSIFERCDSPRLMRLISSFWNRTHHFRRAYVSVAGAPGRGEAMHRRMLEAIAARDVGLLESLAVEHSRESVRSITESHKRS